MILKKNDLNHDFEITAFFEVEHLGPDWSYVGYVTRYSTSGVLVHL